MTCAMNDLGQITVWGQVNGDRTVLDVNDVSGVVLGVVSDVNDVEGVVLGVNDVKDANGRRFDLYSFGGWNVLDVDLGQLTVWGQGNDDSGVNVDLVRLTVRIQGNDTDGFGHGLHKQFPQLLSGKGICFGISCSFLGVLPSGLLKLFLPDFIPALLGFEKLPITLFPGSLVVVLGLSHGCH